MVIYRIHPLDDETGLNFHYNMATAGAKSLINQEKDRDLECPICLTEYNKPKLLPCLHTFCQDCLKRYCDQEGDNMVPCPLCKKKFCEPQGGVDKLPENQFMVRLIQQRSHQKRKCNCDLCRELGEDITADSFCMECRQSLCHRCTKLHSLLTYAKEHKVVSIEGKPTDYELQRLMSSYCNKHGNKELELYCCDCRTLVCVLCHAQDHNKHDCRVSHDIAKRKKELSENDRKNIEKFRIVATERMQKLVKAKQDFLQQVSSTESSLRKSVDTIRKLLDIYENEMLEELISIKKNKIKELESEKDLEEFHYTTLDSFLTYSSMINERGTDCEIIRAADDLHRRAEELIKDQKKKDAMGPDKAQLEFIEPMSRMPDDIKKLVGKIVYKPTDENTAGKKVNIIKLKTKRVTGLTVVDYEIFVVGSRRSQVKGYDSHNLRAPRDINIPDMKPGAGLAGCCYNKALYIGDEELRCIHRFDLTNNSVTRWKMSRSHMPTYLSMTDGHNVLVTVVGSRETLVEEYTSEGQRVREIRIASALNFFNHTTLCPLQTVQLSSDRFIVCHETGISALNGVSLINTKGQIITSYGREGEDLSSIAIDYKSKHVFVADHGKNRILMLDADLTYLDQVHTPPDLRQPHLLYFDSSTDRLIVGESKGGRVLVISTSHSYI